MIEIYIVIIHDFPRLSCWTSELIPAYLRQNKNKKKGLKEKYSGTVQCLKLKKTTQLFIKVQNAISEDFI